MYQPKTGLALLLSLSLLGCSDSPQEKLAAHKSMAAQYFEAGDPGGAVLELQAAQRIAPGDRDVLSQLGAAYLDVGQLVDAYRVFSRLVALDPENLDAQLALGQLYLLADAPVKARERAEGVLAADPGRAEAYLLLGNTYLREGRTDEAVKPFDRAADRDPGDVTPRVMKATAFLSAGRLADARSALLEALARDPANKTCLLLLAQVAELQQEPASVEKAFDDLREADPQNPSVWFAYGGHLLEAGKVEEASEAFRRASQFDPQGTRAWEQLAEIHLAKGDLLHAGEAISAILVRRPESDAGAYYESRVLLGQGRFTDAGTKLRRVLGHYPEHPGALYFLGMAEYDQRTLWLAKTDFEQAIRQEPRLHYAKILLAQTHLDVREFDKALRLTDDLLSAPVAHPEALMIRGTALLALGKAAEARESFDRVLSANPRDARALERRALCQEILAQGELVDVLEIQDALFDAAPGNVYLRLHGKDSYRETDILDAIESLGFSKAPDAASKQYRILHNFLNGSTGFEADDKILSEVWSVLVGRAADTRLGGFPDELVEEVSGEGDKLLPLPQPHARALGKKELQAARDPKPSRDSDFDASPQPSRLPVAESHAVPEPPSAPAVQDEEEPEGARREARKLRAPEAYRDSRSPHPEPPKAEEAAPGATKLKAAAEAFRTAEETRSIAALEAFLREHPRAPQRPEARRLLKALREDQLEKESRERADRAWEQAQSFDSLEAYRDFQSRHPDHPMAGEALRRIAVLEAAAAPVPDPTGQTQLATENIETESTARAERLGSEEKDEPPPPEMTDPETGEDAKRFVRGTASEEGTDSVGKTPENPVSPEADLLRRLPRDKREAIEQYRRELQGR